MNPNPLSEALIVPPVDAPVLPPVDAPVDVSAGIFGEVKAAPALAAVAVVKEDITVAMPAMPVRPSLDLRTFGRPPAVSAPTPPVEAVSCVDEVDDAPTDPLPKVDMKDPTEEEEA